MTARQHELDDALHALHALTGAALTSGALAQQFHVTERAVRVLMLAAETNRLVCRKAEGEWDITDRGRQILRSGA